MQPEVLDRRLIRAEAVMLDQPGQLRLRNRGLRRLDRVENGERLEAPGRRPRLGAARRLAGRLPVEGRLDDSGELVPERHVLGLLLRVLAIARGGGRSRERDDRMPVLAGVEREFIPRQLAAFPTLVERVLQDVPAAPGLVDRRTKLHLAPSLERD